MKFYIFLIILFMTACPAVALPNGTQDDYCNASSVVYVTMPSGVKCGLHFKDLPVGLGSTYKEIITKMGKPMDEGVFEGSYYMTYPDYAYAFSLYVDYNTTRWNDQEFIKLAKEYGKVVSIDRSLSGELCGCKAKVGMTPAEIKKILGKPSFNKLEEVYFGVWVIGYDIGNDITIYFLSKEKDSITTSVTLIKRIRDH